MGAAGITGAEWEALEGASGESLVKHAPGAPGASARGPYGRGLGTSGPGGIGATG